MCTDKKILIKITAKHEHVAQTICNAYMGFDARKPVFGVCEQQRHRSACASVQSDEHLCYSLIQKYHI